MNNSAGIGKRQEENKNIYKKNFRTIVLGTYAERISNEFERYNQDHRPAAAAAVFFFFHSITAAGLGDIV